MFCLYVNSAYWHWIVAYTADLTMLLHIYIFFVAVAQRGSFAQLDVL